MLALSLGHLLAPWWVLSWAPRWVHAKVPQSGPMMVHLMAQALALRLVLLLLLVGMAWVLQ
jgi:hypothetical protein